MAHSKKVDRIESIGKMSLKLDFSKVFGVKVADEDTKNAIGQEVVDIIRQRTKIGEALSGGSFKPYSKNYRESQVFADARKTSSVDLNLTGDMLSSLEVRPLKNGVEISFDDSQQFPKAFNHNTGDTLPKREFFGVTDGELDKVRNKFRLEPSKVGASDLFSLFGRRGENSVRSFIDNLFTLDGGNDF